MICVNNGLGFFYSSFGSRSLTAVFNFNGLHCNFTVKLIIVHTFNNQAVLILKNTAFKTKCDLKSPNYIQ